MTDKDPIEREVGDPEWDRRLRSFLSRVYDVPARLLMTSNPPESRGLLLRRFQAKGHPPRYLLDDETDENS